MKPVIIYDPWYYGRTLAEAPVSEGLAGHFVKLLFGNPPEPWECAVDPDDLPAHLPSEEELTATDYDHAAWFFGAGSCPLRLVLASTFGEITATSTLPLAGRVGVEMIPRFPQ